MATPRHRTPVHRARERALSASGAVLVAVIAVLSAWAHHSSSSGRSARPTANAKPPKPALEQLREWLSDAEPSINALTTARDNIAVAATQKDLAATGAACQTAGAAVVNSQQHLPSPEPALNTALHQAIGKYQAGLGYCLSGSRSQDAAQLAQAAAYFNDGDTDLQAAMNFLDRNLSADPPGSAVLVV
jgi:hypothetical protein